MADPDRDKSASNQAVNAAPVAVPAARIPGIYARERVLLACVVLLVALFVFTAFIARQYHRTLHRLADQWFASGEAALQAGQTATAVKYYRNALVYKPDDPTFQFHLAQALASAGREDEARAYMLSLLPESPGSGPINLALARVAVRQKSTSDAVRYYHSAIYGVWDANPLERRWEVRRELCEYLLNQGDVQQAEPDLIALAQEVPLRDVAREKIAGGLLLRANLWDHALDTYRGVLTVDRRDPDALAGAGRASFELGKYDEAADFLQRLPRERRQAPDIAQMLGTSLQVEAMDPYRTGLPASQQARRASKALVVAGSRLSACAQKLGESLSASPPTSDLQKLFATAQQNEKGWSELNLARHPDQVTAVMSFAFQVEATASRQCGSAGSDADRALSLIAASRTRQSSE
jgi:tetratricopeptide (TPR) repeat protein